MNDATHPSVSRTLLWICFWLVILTSGRPDLLDSIIAFLNQLVGACQ